MAALVTIFPTLLATNSRSDWFFAVPTAKLEIEFKLFLPPFCVGQVELRVEIVIITLFFLIQATSTLQGNTAKCLQARDHVR